MNSNSEIHGLKMSVQEGRRVASGGTPMRAENWQCVSHCAIAVKRSQMRHTGISVPS